MWLLVGIYLGVATVALLIMILGVDSLTADPRDNQSQKTNCITMMKSVPSSVRDIILRMKSRRQLCLIPLTLFIDLSKVFYKADYYKVGHSDHWVLQAQFSL